MMGKTKPVTTALMAALLTVFLVDPAAADSHGIQDNEGTTSEIGSGTSSDGSGGEAEADQTLILIGDDGSPSSPGGEVDWEGVWNNYCGYSTNSGNGGDFGYNDGATVNLNYTGASDTEGNGLYRADCTRADGTGFVGGTFDLPNGVGVPVVDPIVLRDRARARIDIVGPGIESSPSFTDRHAVVRVETWLWVTDPWVPQVESEAEGGVAVTVTAAPTGVVWRFAEPGESGEVTCTGPGVPWTPGATATDCGYTFNRSSAGVGANDAYTASATASWEFRWSLNGVDQGVFADVDGTTDFEIQVGEIQAVGSASA